MSLLKPLLVFARNTDVAVMDEVTEYFTKHPDHRVMYKFGNFSFAVDSDCDPWYTVTFYHRDFS
jgi:hypothetical protein